MKGQGRQFAAKSFPKQAVKLERYFCCHNSHTLKKLGLSSMEKPHCAVEIISSCNKDLSGIFKKFILLIPPSFGKVKNLVHSVKQRSVASARNLLNDEESPQEFCSCQTTANTIVFTTTFKNSVREQTPPDTYYFRSSDPTKMHYAVFKSQVYNQDGRSSLRRVLTPFT